MRKHKERMLLFLITCLSIVQISCTFEEKYITENNNSKNYQLFEKKFSDIIKEKEFKKSFSKVAKPNFNGSSKTIMEQQYGFEIDETAIVKEIHQNGIITYTLGIKTDSLHNNQLRNLLVEQTENNQVSAYILSYHLTAPLLPTGHNSFSLNYSTATIEPINYNANQTSRVLLSNGCYMSNVLMCSEPWVGEIFGSIHVAGHDCDEPAFLSMQTVIDCPSEGGGGGTGGTGGTGGGAPAGGGSASGGPTSPTAPILSEVEDIIAKPCNKIKNQYIKFPSLKQSLIALKGTISQNYENGIFIDNTATSTTQNPTQNLPNTTTTGGSVGLPNPISPTKYVMVAHTHDASGSTGLGTFSIFSWADLQRIAELIKTNHIDTDNFVFYVITADNTIYALTIDWPTIFSEYFNVYTDPANPLYYDSTKATALSNASEKYYSNSLIPGKISLTSNPLDDQKTFLKMMKDLKLDISLFEVGSNFDTFNKLSLNTNSATNINQPVLKKPCE